VITVGRTNDAEGEVVDESDAGRMQVGHRQNAAKEARSRGKFDDEDASQITPQRRDQGERSTFQRQCEAQARSASFSVLRRITGEGFVIPRFCAV
jgi:hypothetical protein